MPASLYCARCGALNPPQASACFACDRSLSEPAAPASDARRLLGGRYRVTRQLGVGGFGAVYQAEDTHLGNRLVAVKEMSPRGLGAEEAREATDAFQREALLLAGLAHPHLPRIYARFEEEGRCYLVMDFIEGETLDIYLDKRGGSLPVKEALQIARQLTDVLGYLHRRQPPIIFRDLKPSNIIRAPDGQVYLIDFGIARLFKPGQSKDTMAFGSPGYAAPEQYGKAQTTPRSDAFSLGALLHQMLTGRDPAETPFRFAPLTIPRPAGLSSLIERMVSIEEAKRPASMEEIGRALTALLEQRAPWRSDEALVPPGVARSPAGGAMSASAATGPVAQPAAYTAPPVQSWPGNAAPQRASKTRKKRGWWIALAVAGAVVLCSLLSHQSSPNFGESPGNIGGNGVALTRAIPVYALAWAQDSNYLASAGDDGTVQIWTIGSSKPEASIQTNAPRTTELAWSPNGQYLASLDNGVIDLWKTGAYTYVSAYEPAAGINAFAWSPASNQLAVALDSGSVHLVNVTTGADTLLFTTRQGSTSVIAWSPDGSYIATGGDDRVVTVWEIASGQAVYSYEGHNNGYGGHRSSITALAWSPDSQRIASADAGGDAQVWDALTGNHPFIYTPDSGSINALAWSPDGISLASGDQEGAVQVWSPDGTDPVRVYAAGYHTDAVRAVAWSPDGKRIASASLDGTVQIWDAYTGKNAVTYQQP